MSAKPEVIGNRMLSILHRVFSRDQNLNRVKDSFWDEQQDTFAAAVRRSMSDGESGHRPVKVRFPPGGGIAVQAGLRSLYNHKGSER